MSGSIAANFDPAQQGRAVLLRLRDLVETCHGDSSYGDKSRALADIDAILAKPDDRKTVLLLAPTGNLQELSMEYGWGEQFLAIAAEIECLLQLPRDRQ